MSKAAELAALIGSQSALSNRNQIINGSFQVWQRGTSSSSNGYQTADRWRLNLSGGSATASQGTFTDGQTAVPGNPQFYMALNVTTGNDNTGWQYRIEDTHKFNSDVYTLSFWAKSATPRVMTVNSHTYDSSADVDDDNTVSPSTFTPTSSWQKFTFKITFSSMPNIGAFASGDYTHIGINQGSDTSTAAWKLDLALVQFEKGEQATPFEHRSFGDELAKCQRYHQRRSGRINTLLTSTAGANRHAQVYFTQSMRAAPTVTGATNSLTFFSQHIDEQSCDAGNTFPNSGTGDYYIENLVMDAEL
tara:strand:+ start:319 stop:1230 length:912 start_codon:yes stop_codon:yes gene_type:complete